LRQEKGGRLQIGSEKAFRNCPVGQVIFFFADFWQQVARLPTTKSPLVICGPDPRIDQSSQESLFI
jgi:hypothetical protein